MMIDGLPLIVVIKLHFTIKNMIKNIHFNQTYINDFFKEESVHKNNIVIFNFEDEDLKSEYERIKSLKLGKVS